MDFFKKMKILPRWIIGLLDVLIVIQCGVAAYLIRFNFELVQLDNNMYLTGVFGFALSFMVSMIFTQSYKGIVRHTGIRDGYIIFKTVALSSVTIIVANIIRGLLGSNHLMPSSVLVITALLSLVFMVGYRVLVKEFFDYLRLGLTRSESTNVAIFGAGQAGMITYDVLKSDTTAHVTTVAFMDDDPQKYGKLIKGVRIYRGIEDLSKIVNQLGVSEVIIAVKDISVERRREIIDACLKYNVHTRIIPPVNQWVNGNLSPNDIREVKIEDLLGREEIILDKRNLEEDFYGKVILVTGAAGSIGSELCRQLIHYGPKKLIMVDQAESALYDIQQDLQGISPLTPRKMILADVRNFKKMKEIFKQYQPDVVFHAAAYKHVPMMENYPEESIACNILGTKVVADLSVMYKARKFVLVSTDKAVNPTNVMGASKRAAEMYVQSLNEHLASTGTKPRTRFITTRFGNVLGSNGSVIPLFKKQIQRGGPVTVTDPGITRFFMTIPEACQLVLEAAVMGNGGEIYVFDMGKPIKIHDLAKKMIQLSGKKVGIDIKIEFTGLREGEKLYEELLNETEKVIHTHHPKIKIAQVSPIPYFIIQERIEMFKTLLEKSNENNLIIHLKNIVPEYVSNASRFEVLDRLN